MKEKIKNFFGSLLGYLVVANVLFAIPTTVYCWYMNHKKINELDKRVDYILNTCDIPEQAKEEEE